MGNPDFRDVIKEALEATKQEADKVNRGAGGREISLVITKLEEALLWAEQSVMVR